MSREYAMSRVRDALEKSDGNHLKAQRLLLQWLEKDHSLLFGLVSPHLQAIIAHAVNHADAPVRSKKMPKTVDTSAGVGEFGEALISTLKGGRASGVGFGEAAPSNVGKPGKASQRHIDAITALTGGKKGDTKGKK